METISSEKYTEIVSTIDNRFGSFVGVIDAVLEAAGVKVEPPPILPEVTPGKWEVVPGEDYNIVTPDLHVAIIKARGSKCQQFSMGELRHPDNDAALANAKFMAGSKGLAEAVIAMFETWSSGGHGKEALSMLKALEDMGCNADKFNNNGQLR